MAANRESDNRLCEYYFSRRDYDHRRRPESDSLLLSLGPNHSDWVRQTRELSNELYSSLVSDLTSELNFSCEKHLTERQIEVLIGLAAYGISRRIAKSYTQCQLLENQIKPGTLKLSLSSHQELVLPCNSRQMKESLGSSQVVALMDAIVINQFFGLGKKFNLLAKSNHSAESGQTKSGLKTRIYLVFQKALRKVTTRNKIVVLSSYLGSLEEFWLGLTLFQWPSFLQIGRNQVQGDKFTRRAEITGDESLQIVAKKLTHLLIPVSLWENYNVTRDFAKQRGFAKNPQVILTSNAFEVDDEFKLYLSENLAKCRYLVGQHGAGYGVSLFPDKPETITNDMFLSWGWEDETKKILPVGVLRPQLHARKRKSYSGVRLIVQTDSPYWFETDTSETGKIYLDRVISLAKHLNKIGLPTAIRPHASTRPDSLNYFKEAISSLELVYFEEDNAPFREIVRDKKLVVFTYDSTGILEMGAQGLPFFFFAAQGLGNIKARYRSNYRALEENELLSESASESAFLLKKFLENNSYEYRKRKSRAVDRFIEGIAFVPNSRIKNVRKAINDQIKAVKR